METQTDIRANILDEARSLFFAHGYSKVLMADLARRLGMSKKTLYQYFSGKEHLLQVIMSGYLAETQQNVELMLQDDTADFPEKLSRIFSYVGTRLHAINASFIADIKKNAPDSWQLLQKYKTDAAFLRFNSLLEEGVQQGHIRQDVNRALAVILYAGALETIFNPDLTRQVPGSLLAEMPDAPAAIFDGLLKVIFNGVLKD
ncbi:TetR/AcrR family transcriptional regulator [Pontibacter ruber]|uniref:TetR/AcrR family transcriptional regulator n=1 Tax=Pontibacter ruber TaxID=1343895 RepID=A0ABW5CT13_9BACT|nr:TetR/AcrR family transcriptional regulator [Pontibacter ruber]